MPSVIANLQQKQAVDPQWQFQLHLNESSVVTGLWWQSPTQAELTHRFHDIIINDSTYNQNQYGYPLNLAIGIDNFGKSQNLWYSFHEHEDVKTENWVLRNHLQSAGQPPQVLCMDRLHSLIHAAQITMPLTHHIYCFYHLEGNIATNLRLALGSQWESFNNDFWALYQLYHQTHLMCFTTRSSNGTQMRQNIFLSCMSAETDGDGPGLAQFSLQV